METVEVTKGQGLCYGNSGSHQRTRTLWKQWQSPKDKDSAMETVEVTQGQERTDLWKQWKSPKDKKGLIQGSGQNDDAVILHRPDKPGQVQLSPLKQNGGWASSGKLRETSRMLCGMRKVMMSEEE